MVCGLCSGDGVLKPPVCGLTDEAEPAVFAADAGLNVFPRGDEEVDDPLAVAWI